MGVPLGDREAGAVAQDAWVKAITDEGTEDAFLRRFPGLPNLLHKTFVVRPGNPWLISLLQNLCGRPQATLPHQFHIEHVLILHHPDINPLGTRRRVARCLGFTHRHHHRLRMISQPARHGGLNICRVRVDIAMRQQAKRYVGNCYAGGGQISRTAIIFLPTDIGGR